MVTVGLQLDVAERVVLAVPAPGGTGSRVIDVVKGGNQVGDIIADPVTGVAAVDGKLRQPTGTSTSDPMLLLGDSLSARWTSLGPIRADAGEWLRQLVATRSVPGKRPRPQWPPTIQTRYDLSDAGWRQRVAVVLPYLESADALTAEIAWGEMARAPYPALDLVRSRIDPKSVARWLEDPALASRRATYLLFIGFVGGPSDAVKLEERLATARAAHDSTNLASMIAADLQLRGSSRVGWVEEVYISDRGRTLPEIEAALLALNVLGQADEAVPRERVIKAYEVFIRERPLMASFVAPQLADWGYWGAKTEFQALLRSQTIKDPASQFAIANYLQRAADAATQ
jgi:hypothetical protein